MSDQTESGFNVYFKVTIKCEFVVYAFNHSVLNCRKVNVAIRACSLYNLRVVQLIKNAKHQACCSPSYGTVGYQLLCIISL